MQNAFDHRFDQLPARIWSLVAQIDELKGRWVAGAQLGPQVLGRLKKSVLVTSTGASTRIEGAKFSDDEVEKLIQDINIQRFAERDTQEVQGYYELLRRVFENWNHMKLSESTIKSFHKELLKYVHKDERHRGEYKKGENRVEMIDPSGKPVGIVFDTTPAYLTPKEMQELAGWTVGALKKGKHHPLLVTGNFTVAFLKIHPFLDGNGRLSRILTNLLLLQQGYAYMPYVSHEKFIEDNKSGYYTALRKSQKTFGTAKEDITAWLDFFLSIILQQSKMAVELLSPESIDKLLSPTQIAVWQYLRSVEGATPKEISENAKVARPTVNQALDRLLRLNKVERLGQGRSTRYRKIQ